jgi:1,4-dihydroxy-2-naphthoyl-CoA hydrolase
MPSRESEYRFRVRLHDIDAAGVMFYGHLFRYAHDAYEWLMGALGFPLEGLIHDGCRLPLVHAEADYLLPLRHGEAIGVQLEMATLGESSFTLVYGFLDEAGILRARVRTVHVHLAPDGQRAAPLPEALRAVLAARQHAG